jgi:hypothetical protein
MNKQYLENRVIGEAQYIVDTLSTIREQQIYLEYQNQQYIRI